MRDADLLLGVELIDRDTGHALYDLAFTKR